MHYNVRYEYLYNALQIQATKWSLWVLSDSKRARDERVSDLGHRQHTEHGRMQRVDAFQPHPCLKTIPAVRKRLELEDKTQAFRGTIAMATASRVSEGSRCPVASLQEQSESPAHLYKQWLDVLQLHYILVALKTVVTFMHLADASNQSHLHCIQEINLISSCIHWKSNHHKCRTVCTKTLILRINATKVNFKE